MLRLNKYKNISWKTKEKGDWIVVENVVLDEEFYQNFKKEIWKKDDYLSIEEYKKLRLL